MSDSEIRLAKSMSVVACEHGNIYFRLHDADGKVFAAGIMDRLTATNLVGEAVDAIEGTFAPEDLVACDGSHD